MNGWVETTLGEVCAQGGGNIQTGPFGSQLHAADYVESGIPSVMPQNIGDNTIIATGIARITEADAVRLGKYRLKVNDIVYSRRGDVERRALVRSENDGWLCGTGCLKVGFGERPVASPAFISYLLGTDESREWIVRHAVGATMLNLNTKILSNVPLTVPPLSEQRAIAEVLGALDDKIAANTKLAATADEFIRASLADLTCDSDNVITIGKLASNRKDLTDPTSLDPYANYVGLEHIPRRSMWLDTAGTADAVTSTKAAFQRGDILFGKLRPYFHKVVAAPFAGVCSTDILVLTPLVEDLSDFVLASVASNYVVERVTAASEGTRMPRTSWKHLAAVEVPWLGEDKAREFSLSVSRLRKSIENLLRENITLAATRDALLPQLMSGKLRVREAEGIVSAAV